MSHFPHWPHLGFPARGLPHISLLSRLFSLVSPLMFSDHLFFSFHRHIFNYSIAFRQVFQVHIKASNINITHTTYQLRKSLTVCRVCFRSLGRSLPQWMSQVPLSHRQPRSLPRFLPSSHETATPLLLKWPCMLKHFNT